MKNDNSEIYWKLSIIHCSMPIDSVAIENILEINGDDICGSIEAGAGKDFFYWLYKTPKVVSVFPDDELQPLLDILLPKIDDLAQYTDDNALLVKFFLVIEYHSGKIPCMVISEQMIDICHKLKSTIEQDIYSDFECQDSMTIEL